MLFSVSHKSSVLYQFLVMGTSGVARRSQDWGNEIKHVGGFPSVNILLKTKLLSHHPLSWDMDCLLTFWTIPNSLFPWWRCCTFGFLIFIIVKRNFLYNSLSVQFSHSVVSNSLRPHELQHARPPCPSPTPGVHSDSHPSSQWCHPAISFSVVPFSCPQSLPASESFPMSQLFTWGGQSTGVSALASFLTKKSQDWSPSKWIGWISLH